MKRYRDWKIRSKLLVPLVVAGLASSLTVVATASLVFRDLREQTILELEGAYALQGSVIELVGDHREYLNLPKAVVRREIEHTKGEVLQALDMMERRASAQARSFANSPAHEAEQEAGRLAPIKIDINMLVALGDQLLTRRDEITESQKKLEEFEEAIEQSTDRLQEIVAKRLVATSQGADPGSAVQETILRLRALGGMLTALQAYISETRDYILEPSEDAQADFAELDTDIQRDFADLTKSGKGTAQEALLVERIRDLLVRLSTLSETTIRQRDNLAEARAEMEALAVTFESDLQNLTESVSRSADAAVKRGLFVVSVAVAATLILTFLTHWWVSAGIAGPIGTLRNVAVDFGKGNLAARATIDRDDDIGELAVAFNEMAGNLGANITALKEAQADLVRKERLAAVGQLTATVSHELRNPLGAMRSATDAIGKIANTQDARMSRAIALLDRSQMRCDRIISELLDFTRVQELNRIRTNIDKWLGSLLEEYELPLRVTLQQKLDSGVALYLDRDRLERTLRNVMDNACDAMEIQETANGEPGDLVLKVATNMVDGRFELTVGDTGVGIPAEDIAKVFEPLFSTKSFGVGLGLPMVKRVLEQHGGGVEIDSEIGRGTDVVLWLPLEQSEREGSGA